VARSETGDAGPRESYSDVILTLAKGGQTAHGRYTVREADIP
jgi:hypothetical protein